MTCPFGAPAAMVTEASGGRARRARSNMPGRRTGEGHAYGVRDARDGEGLYVSAMGIRARVTASGCGDEGTRVAWGECVAHVRVWCSGMHGLACAERSISHKVLQSDRSRGGMF